MGIKNHELFHAMESVGQSEQQKIDELNALLPAAPTSPIFQELREQILNEVQYLDDKKRFKPRELLDHYHWDLIRRLNDSFMSANFEQRVKTEISSKTLIEQTNAGETTGTDQEEKLMVETTKGAAEVLELIDKIKQAHEAGENFDQDIKIYSTDSTYGSEYERDLSRAEILGILTTLGLDPEDLPLVAARNGQDEQGNKTFEKEWSLPLRDKKNRTLGVVNFIYKKIASNSSYSEMGEIFELHLRGMSFPGSKE